MFKVNNRNTRKRCELCSKLTIKTPELRHWRRFGVFIVNFEHISHLFLGFLLLTLRRKLPIGYLYLNDSFARVYLKKWWNKKNGIYRLRIII